MSPFMIQADVESLITYYVLCVCLEITTSTVDMREETGGRPVPKAKVNHRIALCWATFVRHVVRIYLRWYAADGILPNKDFINFGIFSALLSLGNLGFLA